MSDQSPRAGKRFDVLRGVLVAGSIVLTVSLCVYALLVVELGTSSGYAEPITAQGWMQAVSSAARIIALVMTWLAVALTVMAAVTVIAARRRKGAWSWTGVGCIGILLITLLIVAMHGTARLDAITAKATEAVGNNSAIAAPPPTSAPSPPFTVEDARSGIRDMVDVSLDAAVEPLEDATGVPLDVEASLRPQRHATRPALSSRWSSPSVHPTTNAHYSGSSVRGMTLDTRRIAPSK